MVEAVETPEYLAWVQQQKAGENRERERLVSAVTLAEEALELAQNALAAFQAAHDGE